jgi:DNA-binding response OmpR family regulator
MLHGNAVSRREEYEANSVLTTADLRRVLVIAREAGSAELLRSHLEHLRIDVAMASSARQGVTAALSGKYDLIIVDHAPPLMSGLEICRALRAEQVPAAVLVLSGSATDAERILALELGADDCLCKPFNVGELLARVKALLRRHQWQDVKKPIEAASLFIDPAARRVTLAGRDVRLTRKEHDLLYLLASQADRVFTRAQLLSAVWKFPHHGCEHAVSCHINRLRLKIEVDPRNPRYIMTVWGVGYKFAACAKQSGSQIR